MKWCAMVMLAAVFLGGCGPGWGNVDRPTVGSSIPPKSQWRAWGEFKDAQAAVDGSTLTAAVTGASYAGATITVDLGKPAVFNLITMDEGDGGFPRLLAIQTSLDGRNFTQRYTAYGTRRFSVVCIGTPTLARYVRVQCVTPGDRPWRLQEIYLQ